LHNLTALDDETIEWLLNARSSAVKQWIVTIGSNGKEESAKMAKVNRSQFI